MLLLLGMSWDSSRSGSLPGPQSSKGLLKKQKNSLFGRKRQNVDSNPQFFLGLAELGVKESIRSFQRVAPSTTPTNSIELALTWSKHYLIKYSKHSI